MYLFSILFFLNLLIYLWSRSLDLRKVSKQSWNAGEPEIFFWVDMGYIEFDNSAPLSSLLPSFPMGLIYTHVLFYTYAYIHASSLILSDRILHQLVVSSVPIYIVWFIPTWWRDPLHFFQIYRYTCMISYAHICHGDCGSCHYYRRTLHVFFNEPSLINPRVYL